MPAKRYLKAVLKVAPGHLSIITKAPKREIDKAREILNPPQER